METPAALRVDLNADVGESYGPYTLGDDEGLLRSVSSASVACGFHAGDPSVARATIRLARERGVAVGAHPGYRDRVGFGRRFLDASPQEVEDDVLFQVAALAGVAAAEGVRLQHVKPHGALYNAAAASPALADAVARAVAAFDSRLILCAPPGSALLAAGRACGLRVVAEAFADRAYEPNGALVSRRTPGSVLTDTTLVVDRALRLLRERTVTAIDGTDLPLEADTLCVHGDTAGAAALAAALRQGLEGAGVRVCALWD